MTRYCPWCDEEIEPEVTEKLLPAEPAKKTGQLLHSESKPPRVVDIEKCPNCQHQNLYESRKEYARLITGDETVGPVGVRRW